METFKLESDPEMNNNRNVGWDRTRADEPRILGLYMSLNKILMPTGIDSIIPRFTPFLFLGIFLHRVCLTMTF